MPLPQIHTDFSKINMTHHIHALRVGPGYPGRVSPLDGFDRVVTSGYGTFRYFLTIVPTTFVSALWSRTHTFAYSVSEYFLPGPPPALVASGGKGGDRGPGTSAGADAGGTIEQMPAIDFRFSVSPIAVKVWYPARAFGHFLTRFCAVLGGCFALTQWADGLVHFVLKAR
jgi:Endoplasmic reticulum vesicle transporter